MRLARLSLEKYGHFDGRTLDFPAAPMDFHLILGANEAGKSTTLAAVTDLLFGFSTAARYNFQFDNALLRVGAVLEQAGTRLAIRRRRGRDKTLLDAADAPIPDASLAPLLHGLTRDSYDATSSLGHVALRRGGQAIVDAKDDVGQALFAAGSGLLDVQKLLARLEAEADAIWAPRKAASRSYYRAAEERDAAQRRLKEAEVRPKEWTDAIKALELVQAERKALEAERAVQESTLRKVQRVRRTAGSVQARAFLLQGRAAHVPSPFDAAAEAGFRTALEAIETGRQAAQRAEDDHAALRRRLGAIEMDQSVLDAHAAIEALLPLAGSARKGELDLPALQAELDGHHRTIAGLSRELGWTETAPAPSRLALSAVRALVKQRERMAADTAQNEADQRAQATAMAACEAALARHGGPVADAALGRTIKDCRPAVAIESRIPDRRRTRDRTAKALAAALAKLAPWTGHATELAAVSLPSPAEIDTAAGALARLADAATDANRAMQQHAHEAERLRLERSQLAAGRSAVAGEEVLAARNSRDARWAELRAHILGAAPLPDLAEATAGFDAALTQADGVADERYRTAEASARLAGIDEGLERAVLAATQAKARKLAAEAAQAALVTAWHGQLAAYGLPAMTPARAQQWRPQQGEALQAATLAEEAEAALGQDEASLHAATGRVLAALAEAGMAAVTAPGFTAALALAETLLEQAAAAATQRTKLETQRDVAQQAAANARARAAELAAEAAQWSALWADATREAGMAGAVWTTMELRIGQIEEMRGESAAAQKLDDRIAGITRDLQRFADDALKVAESCGVPVAGRTPQELAKSLRDRLVAAQTAAGMAAELTAAIEKKDGERRAAGLEVDRSVAALAPLAAAAASEDLPALHRLLASYGEHRRFSHDVNERERTLLEDGDGLPLPALLAEVADADIDGLPARESLLKDGLSDLNARIATKAQAAGAAQKDLAALDHGNDAALALADLEQARAALAAEAEAYVEKRSQAVMLRWAIDRYRDTRQSPMLTRASAIFNTLTIGRFTDLKIDPEAAAPRLIGIRGGAAVAVDGMSEGTADQLFLALRVAALEQSLDAGVVVPFLADDLFVNFDDERAAAGFRVLGEVARKTQVLFFTHHTHLRDVAKQALAPECLAMCDLK